MKLASGMSARLDCLAGFSLRRRMAMAFLAGAVAALGQAPFGLWPMTILGLATVRLMAGPLLSPRQAAVLWWAAGAGYFALALSWIIEPFLVDVARHGWMAPFALVLMSAGLALFWGAAGATAQAVIQGFEPKNARDHFANEMPKPLGQDLLFACTITLAFVIFGYVRGVIFTGFPWALPGHVLISTPILQFAQLGGAMMLTFIIMALAMTLPTLRHRPMVCAPLWAAALAGVLLLGQALTPPIGETAGRPIVRIVQPNVPQAEKWDPTYSTQHFDRTLAMTAQPAEPGKSPDLIVWPETSVPAWLDQVPHLMPILSEAAGDKPMIFGINRSDGRRVYNSLVQLGQGGQISATYDKNHLVPFGEYIPLGDILGRFGLRGMAQRDGNGFSPGPGPDILDIPGIGATLPLICYEGVFPGDIAAAPTRPEVLMLITNDAWFGTISGPYQHLAQARLRAVEQRLPMIRAANTGVSAMIDPAGRITGALALGNAGILDLPLPLPGSAPLYSRIGDGPLVLGSLFALGLIALIRRRRAKRFRVDATQGDV